ncbi:MAG TPA: GyrI-like domain-containing protein [Candidatus Dormibacteraeota bacterium]|jgi:effector-binding domain-containing protein|nr:GyrI-like domain-containing protein [Candidatus Dormibacteraeota bacterium]
MRTTDPSVVERPEQPYVARRASVTMQTIGEVLPSLNAGVGEWMGRHGLQPVGAPFWKYDVIDMAREMVVQVGFPVAAPVEGDGSVVTGVLPAGRYATLVHTGHPQELVAATRRLLDWGEEQGLRWDAEESPEGDRWGSRLEIYLTDPADQPDMSRWETMLAFRLAD